MESESRSLKDIISGSASAASGVVETKSEDNLNDEVKISSIGTTSSMSTSREDDGKRVKRRVDKDDHIHKDDYSHKKDDQIGKKEEFTFKSKSSFGNVGSLKTSGVNATPVSTFAVATAATSVTTSTMATNPTLSVTTEACEANAGAMMIPTTTMCESSENDDSFRCSVGSPGPKVPPLKIVIPPSESAEQGNRNGKTVTRHHGGLPYIVVSNDESGAASSTCPSSPALNNVKDDDSSTPCNVNLSNDEQRIQQRILRSTNSNKITPNSNNDGNNNGDDCTVNNTNSNNGTHYSYNVDGDGIPASCGNGNDDIKGSAAIIVGDCDTNATSSAGCSSSSNDNGLCTIANLGGNCNIRDSGGNSTTNNANNVDYGSHIGNNSGSRASINNSNSSKGPANNTTIPNTTSASSISSVNNGSTGGSDGGSSSGTFNNNSITSHSNVAGDRTKESQECSSGSNSSETSRNSSPATLEMSPLGDTSINSATFSGRKEDGSSGGGGGGGGGGAVKSKTDSGSSAKSSGPKIESGGNLATMKMKNESSSSSNSKAKNDLEDDGNKVGASGDTKNTTAATGAAILASATDMQSKEASVPIVELHPRKRKLKSKQEISHTTAEGDHSISFGSAPHPHEVPVTNCYQMFMDIRRQIDVKRKGLFPIQPKPPQGFKDYLMNRCTYTLAGNSIPRLKRRNAEPPEGIDDRLKDLYQEQEAERYSLRMQHVVEKEKLVLSVEQEILRVHGRAARALANQALPFSACTILKDEEVYNVITPEQEEKDRNARSRYNGRLFISWLQDVDDKWEKIKEEMLARHHKEAESLNAVQKFNWDLKMRQQGLWKKKNTTPIDESHVPMISVSDDFDLLPE